MFIIFEKKNQYLAFPHASASGQKKNSRNKIAHMIHNKQNNSVSSNQPYGWRTMQEI